MLELTESVTRGGAVLQQRWGSSHSGEDYFAAEFRVWLLAALGWGCFAAALKGVFLQCLGVGLLYSSTEGPQRFVGQAICRAMQC